MTANLQRGNFVCFDSFYPPPSKIGHPKKKQCLDASFLFPVMLICVTDSSFEMSLAYFGQFFTSFG